MDDAQPYEEVRPAERDDIDAVAAVLAEAFAEDPVFAWMLPDAARRRRASLMHFRFEAGSVALPHGTSMAAVDDSAVTGALLALPPGHWNVPPQTLAAAGWGYLRTFGRRLPRAAALLGAIERRHLREPHHYIAYVGVATRAQGRGIGTRLIEPVLARARDEGVPAYLEASNPDCRRLYERLGFHVLQEIRPYGAPPLWLMRWDG